MKVKISLLLCISVLLTFTQCSKEFDTYYDRPSYLEQPIYQELKAMGNFSLYLQAADRTLHAKVLQGAGLYTCFAPNDSTFQKWMTENNYTSVASIPQQVVDDVVAYSLVYNKYFSENLGSAMVSKLWRPGLAYKYKTTYYPMLQRDTYDGDSVWVVDGNLKTGYSYSTKTYIIQNNKYLPVYTPNFFNASSPALIPSDYESFYPGSVWCGNDSTPTLANVGPASILGQQHLAENGVFYEVNRVITPIPTMSNYLKSDSTTSDFWNLINFKLPNITASYYKTFSELSTITDQYRLIYPQKSLDHVYIRNYLGFGFSPVSDSYGEAGSSLDVSQEGGYTMFVPTNTAFKSFLDSKIYKYYPSLDMVPVPVMTELLKAQVVTSLVWPSSFPSRTNMNGEFLTGSARDKSSIDAFGVTDKIMASNGIIYKTNRLIKSRWFESTYSEIFLNPNYIFSNMAFNKYYSGSSGMQEQLMKCTLNGYENERNTVILYKDDLLKADGFYYDEIYSVFKHTGSGLNDANAATRLRRLINNALFFGYLDTLGGVVYKGADLTPAVLASKGLSSYNYWNYRITNNGEIVRFKENKMQATCDVDENTQVTLTPVEEVSNGHVFSADRMLKYSPRETVTGDSAFIDRPLWYYLNKARTENPEVKSFVDLVEQVMKSLTSSELLGVKAANYYTVLMPNNSAMLRAKNAGLYPTTINAGSDPAGVDKALRFLQCHFLVGKIFADDNLPIMYPFSPLAENAEEQVCQTLLSITNDKLGLVNEKVQVMAYKQKLSATTNYLKFYALDLKRGNSVLVKGSPALSAGVNNHLNVSRAKLTAAPANDYTKTRSNRMACKAVLHEVNNYLNFEESKNY